jgi:hypothetical protein
MTTIDLQHQNEDFEDVMGSSPTCLGLYTVCPVIEAIVRCERPVYNRFVAIEKAISERLTNQLCQDYCASPLFDWVCLFCDEAACSYQAASWLPQTRMEEAGHSFLSYTTLEDGPIFQAKVRNSASAPR